MAATNRQDEAALSAELAALESREKEIGVRKAVVQALISCGSEPPEAEGDFDKSSPCLYRELRPRQAELGAESTPEAKGESGAKLAVA